MIRCKRRVVRETSEIHGPTGKPYVVRLDAGGRTVSIKIKGTRTWYVVTVKQIWTTGGWNAAAVLRAARKAKRDEKRRERQS